MASAGERVDEFGATPVNCGADGSKTAIRWETFRGSSAVVPRRDEGLLASVRQCRTDVADFTAG